MLLSIVASSCQSFISKKRHTRDALQVVSRIKKTLQEKNVELKYVRHNCAKLVTSHSSLLSRNLLKHFEDKKDICDIITLNIHINSRK